MTPNTSAGDRTTRTENKATTNVPPSTVSALTDTTTKELDTKLRNKKGGRKTRLTRTAGRSEMNGWFTINS